MTSGLGTSVGTVFARLLPSSFPTAVMACLGRSRIGVTGRIVRAQLNMLLLEHVNIAVVELAPATTFFEALGCQPALNKPYHINCGAVYLLFVISIFVNNA